MKSKCRPPLKRSHQVDSYRHIATTQPRRISSLAAKCTMLTAAVFLGRRRGPTGFASAAFSSAASAVSSDPISSASPDSSLVIGNQRIVNVMAPMVSQSDTAFRLLGRNHGCDLCFTQMIHAKNILKSPAFLKSHMDFFPRGTIINYDDLLFAQKNCLEGLNYRASDWPEEGPLVAQLAGHDPHSMVDAAQLLLEQSNNSIHGIDVNLGCPQGIAKKGRYGAFLIEEDIDLVCTILNNLRASIPSDISVSAKIRIPTNHDLLEERILKLIDTGISFLTVHGRTLEENKTRVGPCRLNLIEKAVKFAQKHSPGFPIIANGGVETYHDVGRILSDTGAAAVMSSEALLEVPTLFKGPGFRDTDDEPRELLNQQLSITHEYLDLCTMYPPVPGCLGYEGGSFNVVRGHLFKLMHRYLQGEPRFRTVLSDGAMKTISQARQLLNDIDKHYSQQQSEQLLRNVSGENSSWYRRHRNAASTEGRVARSRGDDYIVKQNEQIRMMSIEERKKQAKARIAKLRQDKQHMIKQEQKMVA